METLEKFPPSFKKDGMVTAGNASGIVDGAAAVVVTLRENRQENGDGSRSDELFHGRWQGLIPLSWELARCLRLGKLCELAGIKA